MILLLLFIALSIIFTVLAGLLAAVETAVLLLPLGRVHRLAEAKEKGAERLEVLVEKRHRLRSASSLVYAIAAFLAGAVGYLAVVAITERYALAPAFAIALAALSIVVMIGLCYSLSQALPRTVAVANPARIALSAAPIALPIVFAIHPLGRVLGAPWRWLAETVAKEQLLTPWAVISESRGATGVGEEGDRDREEAEEALLEAVSDFAEKVAREVMVPRTDVAALPDTAAVSEAVALIHKTGYSRLPVYHDSIDDIRGVLFAKDLLVALDSDTEVNLASIARAPFFVPETKPVQELLVEMRATTHIAIVADEYGGTSGIVTLEDLLEEIVGDISDEYDREEPLIVELGEGRYRVDAMLPVDDLNELFGTDLDTEADSVGGLFTEVVGRIPELGESTEIEGLRITVLERQGTRVRQLSVEPALSGDTEEAESDA